MLKNLSICFGFHICRWWTLIQICLLRSLNFSQRVFVIWLNPGRFLVLYGLICVNIRSSCLFCLHNSVSTVRFWNYFIFAFPTSLFFWWLLAIHKIFVCCKTFFIFQIRLFTITIFLTEHFHFLLNSFLSIYGFIWIHTVLGALWFGMPVTFSVVLN